MKSKILSKEEKEKIEKMAEYLLLPIEGSVKISNHYSTINCSMGYNHTKWDEYWYDIKIKTSEGSYEYGETFDESADPLYLAQVSWGIAYNVWSKYDGDIYSKLAENLWPEKDGQHIPDYKALLKI